MTRFGSKASIGRRLSKGEIAAIYGQDAVSHWRGMSTPDSNARFARIDAEAARLVAGRNARSRARAGAANQSPAPPITAAAPPAAGGE